MPAFIFSCIVIVIVSLLSEKPSSDIMIEFERARKYKLEA